ncbi:hypothetical protein AB0B52_36755, partial [Streptomyces griseofuscus]|uniref:hypothetical protein n=1 Tax=Streptomyces griseofuscus TaxID=146922 RepID=UPI0033E2E02D
TPEDRAWAQRHPSHLPDKASQFRCHPIVRQTQQFLRLLVVQRLREAGLMGCDVGAGEADWGLGDGQPSIGLFGKLRPVAQGV